MKTTMTFVVVDVETANADLSSVCQIGIADFRDGKLYDQWVSFVNPQDEFDPINVSIHGIDENMVADAPVWKAVFPMVTPFLRDKVVVSHTPFDRLAMSRACERDGLTLYPCEWLDSARVVRRAWPTFAYSGYGLSNVATYFGIEYTAHNALEDARCAGEILLRAIAETGLTVEQWLKRVRQPIHLAAVAASEPIRRDGNPDGVLYGEVLVFTGALSMPRREAADAAAVMGCRVDAGVTKHTTLLVVGDQDVRRLNGHRRSSKHLKAEQLIAKGQPIRILSEGDFRRLVLRSTATTGGTAQ